MNRFARELKVIPRAAWMIGTVLYLAIALGLGLAFAFNADPEMSAIPTVGKILLTIFPALLVFIPIGLFGYVNGDAKRRGMRYVMWTLLAIFIPNGIGVLLYFLLRDPMPRPCTGCGNVVHAKFAFCSQCGTEVQKACPNCRRPVESTWANCAYCGIKLAAGMVKPAPAA